MFICHLRKLVVQLNLQAAVHISAGMQQLSNEVSFSQETFEVLLLT